MLGFCEKCHDMTEYFIEEVDKEKCIKGKNINYKGREAYCKGCREEIFVSDIRDYNLQMLDDAYRNHEGLILISEIEGILEKYSIGKRPLSLLLGWGEGTLTRYLNGDIPTKQYSDTLKRILEDSSYMLKILEENKDKITERAYNNCKKSIEYNEEDQRAITMVCNDKIDSVIKYMLLKCEEITPLALQKLLYYSQAFYKIFNGEYLFNNDCEAWVHGPVYRDVYFRYKNHGYNPIEENIDYDDIDLTEIEKEVINSVIKSFGCYSGKILENMTHVEMPWIVTRIGLESNDSSDKVITKELIDKYFYEIKLKYSMLNIYDIKDYSENLFDKINNS
ncbi:type II toxin-antitoxin system antitoxin SocA domain-containing protein [Clostridium cylindrosporum]|uniref:Antitoxin SocA-like Panacea domain-containing protein n=1 Tax=Clostridium cylindrosporum DSM 605 TaxID=1121307 RepID=A0A0J8DEN6_CLOCY|nr:type II toxin-antitoxin system antitoxin SocA domain-containing protein [Clostridium cylindrosporum]KMT22648.1 hypothetical protein CLCY_9c00790 [Clostridium cylindrosporum DSM 605]